jgi:anti-anti-sigma regulatory factor
MPSAPCRPASCHVATADPERGLTLVDVEGELEAAGVASWSWLLDGAMKDGATGIAVDLRACHLVDPICLSVMLATSSILKARGGGGVNLVTDPESRLDRKLRALAAKELPAYSSAAGALLALREAV